MHLYLSFLCCRDYFFRPDSSPACSFAPQGLFLSARFISGLLFCSAGIISAARIHLWLALLFHRDYFGRSDSSPACSFSPQGLFRPARFISSSLFSSTGIISAARIHPQPALLFRRDYFGRPDSSLQADFLRCGCISALFLKNPVDVSYRLLRLLPDPLPECSFP